MSEDVLISMSNFIINKNMKSYIEVVSAMRRDLWGRKIRNAGNKTAEHVLTILLNKDYSILEGRG